MKKIILFAAVVAGVSFASCKKDRTCTCVTTDPNSVPTSQTEVYTITKSKKGDAKKMCINSTGTNTSYINGVATTSTYTTTCTLK